VEKTPEEYIKFRKSTRFALATEYIGCTEGDIILISPCRRHRGTIAIDKALTTY
jgi:hypothetical protein